jgi:hypothetical protein
MAVTRNAGGTMRKICCSTRTPVGGGEALSPTFTSIDIRTVILGSRFPMSY